MIYIYEHNYDLKINLLESTRVSTLLKRFYDFHRKLETWTTLQINGSNLWSVDLIAILFAHKFCPVDQSPIPGRIN